MTQAVLHQPVLLQEVIKLLQIKPGEAYLDATVGSGGHSLEILKKGGQVYGLDVDPGAISRAKERFSVCPNAFFHLKRANFSRLEAVAKQWGKTAFAGILFDLGLSSEQLADETRGFSFQVDSPLDMRADPDLQVTAADLVNGLNKGELNELFTKLAEEQHARTIAAAIIRARGCQRLSTTGQLAQIVERAAGRQGRIHSATKIFQALRIAVNDELNSLKEALPQAVGLLKKGGRLVIISFHSLEDRIAKNFIKDNHMLINLTKHPLRPSSEEVLSNRRARSAKLRAAEKI